jgi:DNA-binding FadR family transcriptional regulator
MIRHYGVSRESLREGLRLLEVQGLITLRRGPGGGPVVGHIDPATLGRTSTLYYHVAGPRIESSSTPGWSRSDSRPSTPP